MEIFLAGEHPVKNGSLRQSWEELNILETFYYLRDNSQLSRLIKTKGNFLLDSGAFTFMSVNNDTKTDFDKYVEEYAAFVKRYDINLFFELDIDSIVGIKEVERLRQKLERLSGRKPIPVWHNSRGKDYFINMCKEYPYVAIGGIVTKEIPTDKYERLFPWFISTAHKYHAKIHGLGYTRVNALKKYHFDSVDSTAWLYGNRGGFVYSFNPRTAMMEQKRPPQNSRLRSKEVALHNFNEWVRLQKYARKYL